MPSSPPPPPPTPSTGGATTATGTTYMYHLSPDAQQLHRRLWDFVRNECHPAEAEYESHIESRHGSSRWTNDAVPPCMERLKRRAKELGLWNLFLLHHDLPAHFPDDVRPSVRLTTVEYGILCEVMGHSFLAPEACNCSAPDTGNMEVLLQFGTKEQQDAYLLPLLEGKVRSAFFMTEPDVASSDATNISTKLTKIVEERRDRDGQYEEVTRYELNGRKWWITGAMDPRCHVAVILARTDYSHPSLSTKRKSNDISDDDSNKKNKKHRSHTVVVIPMKTSGIECVRPLTVFGHDDAPHGHAEVKLTDAPVPSEAVIGGEGRGFEIAQNRLGPGRIHHCMRAVGMAQRCYDMLLRRSMDRVVFGKELFRHGMTQELIADAAIDLEAARLLTLSCASAMDIHGIRGARDKIAMIKVSVPELAHRVVDRAVQVFGGGGVSSDYPLARILVGLRTLRIADGPDAVHKRTIALMEIKSAHRRFLQGGSKL